MGARAPMEQGRPPPVFFFNVSETKCSSAQQKARRRWSKDRPPPVALHISKFPRPSAQVHNRKRGADGPSARRPFVFGDASPGVAFNNTATILIYISSQQAQAPGVRERPRHQGDERRTANVSMVPVANHDRPRRPPRPPATSCR